MAPMTEFSFSELLQQPTRVAAAVEERGRVILHRRSAPDLVLSRASDLAELGSFARLLAAMTGHLRPAELATVITEALPWTRYLTDAGRGELVAELPKVIGDCEDLGTLAPLEITMAGWRATAAIQADPELADRLTRPIPEPLARRVQAP